MPVHAIDDPLDPRLEDFRDIRDRDARGPDGRPGVFIGEQGLVVEKMLVIPDRDRPATVLVCESIRNIDNIGALFRVAAAFGVDAVVLSPDCHDPLYRKSLRVSIGHALSIPFARSRDWTADLAALGDRHGLLRIGASVGDGSIRVDAVPEDDRQRRVAIVMGSEFEGLSAESTSGCDALVRIAMAPGVDSLNVAVAAAVLLDRFSTARRI
jgi:tRNA G18 (ribose-2'-O)-methylase SpoU